MKKLWLLVIALCVVLLMGCCAAEEAHEHYGVLYCHSDIPVCKECGQQLPGEQYFENRHTYVIVEYGGNSWSECQYCGVVCRHNPVLYCYKDVPECSECGQLFPEEQDYYIQHFFIMENYGEYCVNECKYCGEAFNRWDGHWVSCADRTHCTMCGTTGLPENCTIYHFEDVLQGDNEVHYLKCRVCQQTSTAEHYVECSNPTVCLICGATGLDVAISRQDHNNGRTYLEASEEGHIYYCSICDYREVMSHWVHCDNLQFCHFCQLENIKYTPYDIEHIIVKDSVTYDEQVHQFECSRCGEVELAHQLWEGKCVYPFCGYHEQPTPPVLPGDPTGDGTVDIFDALAVLQCAVGWESDIDQEAGDVNDDGACDIFDALLILQYSVGWDVELK